jgi:hypothetical protein
MIKAYLVIYLFSLAIEIRSLFNVSYPLAFTVVRNVALPLNMTLFLNKTGCCLLDSNGNQGGYNVISLDGFTSTSSASTLQNNASPLGLWMNAQSTINANKPTSSGNSNSQIQQNLLQQYHKAGTALLFNALTY